MPNTRSGLDKQEEGFRIGSSLLVVKALSGINLAVLVFVRAIRARRKRN